MKGPAVRPDRITGNGLLTNKVPRATVETPMREHVPGDAEMVVQACKDKPCAAPDVEPELWFPLSDTTPSDRRQIAVAKSYCRRCPVQDACLEFAMRSLPNGIAGGLTEWERRDNRRSWAG